MSATPVLVRSPLLRALWARGCRFLGTELAILGGAMTWVSERHLVSAISNAGGFGVLACGSMGPDALAAEIAATRARTDRPFGVNLIVMHPELDELVGVCIAHKVSHVVLAGGLPPPAAVARLKRAGTKVLAFAPTATIAKKLVRQGIDALVIEGHEAGGHVGPVSTSVLAQEILPEVREVPVFVAGGIGHGEMIAAYLLMGAAGVQMGTRFVCASESIAHPAFKEAFIRASARDAQVSVQVDPQFKVVPVRALVNAATRRFVETQHEVIARWRAGEMSYEEASLAIEHFWAGALKRAVLEGDVENGSLMAGQSVGMVKRIQPTAAILAELVEQAEAALARVQGHRLEVAAAG
ncbi:MAG: nitronate monooxygenase [Geminicoccaceae bacterium]|nr:nitronate monooxygenase [Geminicoccaceae bacterium]MCS7269011.1 nitronate monooxygenase [Geminicoccaceae bacterium]MDW8123450.1 nitronate monooxygenase [Geminicoccaceae bacterium]MDW8342140.1 nitronate monooxygenase [Geminicoccaceae bacterium]